MGIKILFSRFLILVKKIYHFYLPLFGAVFYKFPSRKLIVIGVTGTNGKTTVVSMITDILEEAGFKVASSSSIKFKIGQKERINKLKMTMPGSFKIQRFLWQAVKDKCQYAVIEVTSEGILQYRHRFIDFDVAVLTNISPEHIERHHGFENYIKAKSRLFSGLKNSFKKKNVEKVIVLNGDDEHWEYFSKFSADKKYIYSLKNNFSISNQSKNNKEELIKGKIEETNNHFSSFSVNGFLFQISLWGRFNIYNSLASISVALSQKIDPKVIQKALSKIKMIPGREEIVISEPFKVIVDYAHNPAALKNLYESALKLKSSNSKIICVLGSCGGGRDKWKRPVMGKIAAHYCDRIIITNEDPYDENPENIMNQVQSGVTKSEFPSQNFYRITDRREAISKSLHLAQPGDIVIISGKGSEPWMCLAHGQKIPWDDRKIVKEEYEKEEIT